MKIEDSEGKILEAVNEGDVAAYIERIGKDLDHCILSDGDRFIQAASTGDGLLVEYRDATGYYRSDDESLSSETVLRLFSSFLRGEEDWKNELSFSLQGSSEAVTPERSAARSAGSSSPNTTEFEQKSIKDTVVDSVKREARNSFSYWIQRITRRFFRRLF